MKAIWLAELLVYWQSLRLILKYYYRRNKVLCTHVSFPFIGLWHKEPGLKMQVNNVRRHLTVDERKEKVEDALATLRALKWRISELRAQCEVVKEKRKEGYNGALLCSDCGKLIEQGEEVTLKGSFGEVKSHYHKDCFKRIWLSQNWRFDYSSGNDR